MALPVVHLFWGFWDPPSPLPAVVRRARRRWNRLGFPVRVWTPGKLRELVWRMPDGKQVWARCSDIQRCDVSRYALLYCVGGMYADVDCVPDPSIADSLRDRTAVMFCEAYWNTEGMKMRAARRHPIRRGAPEIPFRVANYALVSVPRNPLLLKLWRKCRDRVMANEVVEDYDVLYTTGPDVVTQTFHDFADLGGCDMSTVLIGLRHEGHGTWKHKL